jgi:hypothetical protein
VPVSRTLAQATSGCGRGPANLNSASLATDNVFPDGSSLQVGSAG